MIYYWRKMGLAVAGCFLAILIVEGFAWLAPDSLLYGRLREIRAQLERHEDSDSYLIPDAELLFKIKPNSNRAVEHADYSMRIVTRLNFPEIGFRGGSLGGPPWAVAVGDSFTFGFGVDHEDVWTSMLARSLGKEVINFGVPAQGPVQYTKILKRYALPMRPRVVFYGFYFNDLDSAARFHRLSQQLFPVKRYLRQYSYVYHLIRGSEIQKDRSVLFKAGAIELELDLRGMRRNLQRQDEKFDERWQVVRVEIDEAIKSSRQAGVTFVLFYFPSRWEVYWEKISEQLDFPSSLDVYRLRRQVVQYCTAKKIPCLDLTPALKEEAAEHKQLYFRTDGHWNEAGNRVVADTIREYLHRNRLGS